MTLDLVRIAEQLPVLLDRLAGDRLYARERLSEAVNVLARVADQPALWRVRLDSARTRWPLALPLDERADRGYRAPPPPDAHAVLAVDGSHIDVDRHAPAACYVPNLGWSAIFYGVPRPPELDSRAELQPSDGPLVQRDEHDASHEHAVRGEVLSLLRDVRELAMLAERAAALPPDLPHVALLDGNLGLWNVSQAAISKRMRDHFIEGEGGLLSSLNRLRALAHNRPLAFGAYTSAPGTSEVVNALRMAVCPLEDVLCTRCPGLMSRERPCDAVGVANDAELFWSILAPGERSALFRTRSRAFLRTDTDGEPLWYEQAGHTVDFFYLHVGNEIARVELPSWAAADASRVGLLHAVLLQQCEKGPGYPVALQEAHEQAVITTVDRRSFAALLDREVTGAGISAGGSAKARSKRIRSI
jgi:hypothetical protein